MHSILKKISLNFAKLSHPSLRQNQECTMNQSSCKKLIDVFVLNFEAVFSAQGKVRNQGFCIEDRKSTVTEHC